MSRKEKQNQPRQGGVDQLKTFFENNSSFVVTGHINPDGDTIGSELAIYSWLSSMGKTVDVVNTDPVPGFLTFLDDWDVIKTSLPQDAVFDAAIILECPDISRSGGSLSKVSFKSVLNIDHHMAGLNPEAGQSRLPTMLRQRQNMGGQVNFVDASASSCAELVFRIMKQFNHTPTREEASALLTGIITDTNRFQQANTTTESLSAASELVKAGASTEEITRKVYNRKRFQALKLIGIALGSLQQENSIAYMKITRDMAKKVSAAQEDFEDVINYAGMLSGVEIFALFRELGGEKNVTKVSLRSHSKVNVNAIASKYGGGGHYHAAGFKFEGTADEAILNLVPILKGAAEQND